MAALCPEPAGDVDAVPLGPLPSPSPPRVPSGPLPPFGPWLQDPLLGAD